MVIYSKFMSKIQNIHESPAQFHKGDKPWQIPTDLTLKAKDYKHKRNNDHGNPWSKMEVKYSVILLLIEHFPENYLYENCAGLLAFWRKIKIMLDYLYNVVFFYLYSSKGGFPDTNPCYIPLSEINTAEFGCRLVVLETNIKNSNFLMINSHPSRGWL